MKKGILIIIGIVIVTAVAILYSPRRAIDSDKPIVKIGLVYPMTGDGAIYGETSRKVIDLMLKNELKKRFPKQKYEYEFIFEDAQLSAPKAVTAMQKLVGYDKIDAVMSILSSQALVINPIAEKHKVIQLSYTMDKNAAAGYYNYQVTVDNEAAIKAVLDNVKKNNSKKVALAYANDHTMMLIVNEIKRQAKNDPEIKFVVDAAFNPGDKNFDTIALKIKKASPDMLVFAAIPPESDLFLRTMKKNEINIPTTGFQILTTVIDRSLVEGMTGIDVTRADSNFLEEFYKKIGGNDTYYSEATYAGMLVLINAWENAPAELGQKPDIDAVIETMKNKTDGLKSLLGELKINKDGNIMLAPIFMKVENGEMKILKD